MFPTRNPLNFYILGIMIISLFFLYVSELTLGWTLNSTMASVSIVISKVFFLLVSSFIVQSLIDYVSPCHFMRNIGAIW